MSHAIDRLTVQGRRILVEPVIDEGRPVAQLERAGVSPQYAHRWIDRFRAKGHVGLAVRSCRPRRTPRAVLAARA